MDLYALLATIGGGILLMVVTSWKAYRAGQDREKAKKAEQDAQLRFEFDKIDSRAPDYDGSIERLRKRSSGDHRAGSK